MISGGWILWNAFAVCEMTKTSWQTGSLQMNEDLGSFWDIICSQGEFWEEDILIVEIEELEKLKNLEIWRHWKIFQKTECEGSSENPKRWRICISCSRSFTKNIREKLQIPRTHSETGIRRKKREYQRRISRRWGRVSTWRIKKMTKESTRFSWLTQKLGKNFTYRHHIEPRSSIARAEKRTYPIRLDFFWCHQVNLCRSRGCARKANLCLLGCRREQKFVNIVNEFHKIYVIEWNSSEKV